MDETRPLELNEIEVPPSVLRVLRFLDEYSFWLDSSDEDRSTKVGTIGLQSLRFSDRVASHHDTSNGMLQTLKVRHGVFAQEIREFVFWLKQSVMPAGGWEGRTEELAFLAKPSEVVGGSRRSSRGGVSPALPLSADSIELIDELEPGAPAQKIRLRRQIRSASPELLVELMDDRPDVVTATLRRAKPALWPSALGIGSFAFGSMVFDGHYGHTPLGAMHGLAGVGSVGAPMHYPSPIVSIDQPVRLIDAASRAALGRGLSQHQAAGFPRVPSRDLMGGLPGPLDPERSPIVRTPASLPFNPLLGQVTLVTPPVRVADPKLAGKGAAVAFDLSALKKGAGQLTPDSLKDLKQILPPGTQALYPALAPDSLGPSGVNVPLAPETINLLVDKGYGRSDPGWARSVASLAWSTPAATALTGNVVPNARPVSGQAGFGAAIASLNIADQRQPATRGGILDFLGMPIRLAPSPDRPHELHHRHVARTDMRMMPTPLIRPNLFASIQRQAFPHIQTVTARPDAPSWRAVPSSHSGIGHVAPVRPVAHTHAAPMIGSHLIPRIPVAHSLATPTARAMAAPHHGSSHAPPTSHAAKPLIPVRAPIATAVHHPATHAPPISERRPGPKAHMPTAGPPTSHKLLDSPDLPVMHPPHHHAPDEHIDPHLHDHAVPHIPLHVEHAAPKHAAAAPKPRPLNAHLTVAPPKPAMPLAGKPAEHHEDKHLAVQASPGDPPEPAEKAAGSKSSTSGGAPKGGKDAEIGLLANEVWSVLKRRLAFEAQRAGHH